jgi:ubiquinone/menaquinone biosynthesis C-methylase UbiE
VNGNSRDLNQSGVPRALATEHLYGAVLRLLDTPLGGRILDMPAGQGAFAQALLERGAEEIHCLDINAEAFILSDRRVAFLKHDAMQSLPFPDAYFDHVYSIEGIEHFESPWTVVRELCRVLKPGGQLIITTPNTFSVDARLKYLLSGYFPRFRPLMQTPEKVMEQPVDDAHISPIYFWQLNYFLLTSGVPIKTLTSDCRLYKSKPVQRWIERIVAGIIRNNIRKRRFPDPGVTSEDVLFGDCLIVVARKSA